MIENISRGAPSYRPRGKRVYLLNVVKDQEYLKLRKNKQRARFGQLGILDFRVITTGGSKRSWRIKDWKGCMENTKSKPWD